VCADTIIAVIAEVFLPTTIPITTESAIALETIIATSPPTEIIVSYIEVDRNLSGQAIPAIFTGVSQRFSAPAP
jgi:hypothetical protein